MLRRVPAARPALRAEHHRHARLPAEHEAVLGRLVDHLIHRQPGEVDVHELDDRTQTGERGAHGGADDADLADRRLADARRAEAIQETCGDLKGPAMFGDVLADHDHALVALHLEAQGLVQRLAVEHLTSRGAVPPGPRRRLRRRVGLRWHTRPQGA